MAKTYLYSVSPKKPIRFLCGEAVVPPIRTPRSLQMTLEQVKDCLNYGSVYRRFNEEGRNERVTTANVERLHNANFIEEKDYFECLSKVVVDKKENNTDERGTAEITEEVEPAIEANREENVSVDVVSSEVNSENATEDQSNSTIIPGEEIEEDEIDDSIDDEIVETTDEVVEESIYEESEDEFEEQLEEDTVEEDTTIDEESHPIKQESYSNKNRYNGNKNYNKKKH